MKSKTKKLSPQHHWSTILFISLTFFTQHHLVHGQNPREILQSSYSKCQSIQNGYYEMTKYMKHLTDNDTVSSVFNTHFSKSNDDSLFSSVFRTEEITGGKITDAAIYNGKEFISIRPNDSSIVIMETSKWNADVKIKLKNQKFYTPLTHKKSKPVKHDMHFTDQNIIINYIGTEIINTIACHHIQVNEIPTNDSTAMVITKREEYHFWIRKDNFIPIQYTIAFDVVLNKVLMYQYEKFVLNTFEENKTTTNDFLSTASLPSFYKMRDYVPYKQPDLLKTNTIAPDWEMTSLKDEKLRLSKLKGEFILMDFFYKSCGPCIMALPGLQALHNKYKARGLRVIGIDTYDKNKDQLSDFLEKRGVTYTILIGEENIAKAYNVSGYPTMYLIDKTGKVIKSFSGYSKKHEEDLDKLFEQLLK